jgi:hypothetical protein
MFAGANLKFEPLTLIELVCALKNVKNCHPPYLFMYEQTLEYIYILQ